MPARRITSITWKTERGRARPPEGGDDMTGFYAEDEEDVLTKAGIDPEQMEYLSTRERREALEEAGLDPDEYDF